MHDMMGQARSCFSMHRVTWVQSFLNEAGDRMLCWYRAGDAESARIALRELGSDMNAVWAGSVIDAGTGSADASALAEIRFDQPFAGGIAGLTDLVTGALAARQDAGLARAFVATGATRMVCLFRTPDIDAVQSSLEAAGLAAASVWRCVGITPRPALR